MPYDAREHASLVQSEALRRIETQSVIPIGITTKKPLISWLHLQDERPTEDDVAQWLTSFGDYNLGMITGAISGWVVLDADNAEAVEWVRQKGLATGYEVRTRRGRHFYFRHPGIQVRNAKNLWSVKGLDLRGDGGYVLVPPSRFAKDGVILDDAYTLEATVDPEDLPEWVFDGTAEPGDPVDIGQLDLTWNVPADDKQHLPVKARLKGKDKMAPGEGRGTMVARYVGELVKKGVVDTAELTTAVDVFMAGFFTEPLLDEEVQACIRAILRGEQQRHPERFLENVQAPKKAADLEATDQAEPETSVAEERPPFLFTAADLDDAIRTLGERKYLIEPWLPEGAIVQVHGYSGHGKSLFVMGALWSAAAGQDFGTFLVDRPVRTLYIDFENGKQTLVERMRDYRSLARSPGDRFNLWSAGLDPERVDWHFREEGAMKKLGALIRASQPEVIVLDTTRSGFPGLEETKAEAWAPVNKLLRALRDRGYTVIFLHHSRKPGEDGFTGESGSTSQLINVDTQVQVLKVVGAKKELRLAWHQARKELQYAVTAEQKKEAQAAIDAALKAAVQNAKEEARAKAAVADFQGVENLREHVQNTLGQSWFLRTVTRVGYGKIRDESANHLTVDVAWAYHRDTGELKIITVPELPKTRARDYAATCSPLTVQDAKDWAQANGENLYAVKGWMGLA